MSSDVDWLRYVVFTLCGAGSLLVAGGACMNASTLWARRRRPSPPDLARSRSASRRVFVAGWVLIALALLAAGAWSTYYFPD